MSLFSHLMAKDAFGWSIGQVRLCSIGRKTNFFTGMQKRWDLKNAWKEMGLAHSHVSFQGAAVLAGV